MWRRSGDPSLFQLLGFRVDKIVSQGVTSLEFVKESERSIQRRIGVMESPISGIQASEVKKGSPLTSRVVKLQKD
jgi:hypothetical protein